MALLEKLRGRLTAQNVFLDENTGGKGKYFKARFLQPGLVKYSFGVCMLEKDTIDKFIQGFVGCPVIIGHNDVTNENAKKLSCGNICHIWYDESDGWYWGDGIIDDEEAINKINQGYNVSCQYEITEYSNNTTNALHNGNPYDKVILNGKPEHLAIVDKPRYENAMIAVNALDLTAENEDKWVTIKPNGEKVKGRHLLIKDGENVYDAMQRQWGVEVKGQQHLFDRKKYKTDTNYKDELRGKLAEHFKQVQKRYDNLEYLGVAEPDKLKDEDYEDISFEEWENKKTEPIVEGIKKDFEGKEIPQKIKEDFKKTYGIDFPEGEEKKEDKKYGGLSEDEYTEISKEYQEIKKVNFLGPQQIKRLKEIYPYFIEDAEFSSQSDEFNEPTKDYYKKQVNKLKQSAEELKDWFDLSKHKEKHMSSEWKKYLKEHPEEFTNKAQNVIKQAINEIKETDMFNKLFNRKDKQMEKDEMKSLFIECLQECLKAKNEEDAEDKKDEDKEEDLKIKEDKAENKCKNEDVDKRDIIRQIMAIAGKREDDEDVKTIAKLAEKLAYDKSEAGTADNEDDEEDKKEKEEAKNKAKNSLEQMKAMFSQTEIKKAASSYVSRDDAIELGNEIFG